MKTPSRLRVFARTKKFLFTRKREDAKVPVILILGIS